MTPTKLFLVVFAAILAAAGAIYGIRQASAAHERAQYVKSIHRDAITDADRRLNQISEMRWQVSSVPEKRELLALLWQFKREAESELAFYRPGSGHDEERKFWTGMLAKIEELDKQIAELKTSYAY